MEQNLIILNIKYFKIFYILLFYKMQLLLVDNRVKDVETVTQSLLPGVDHVLVDFETDTYEHL